MYLKVKGEDPSQGELNRTEEGVGEILQKVKKKTHEIHLSGKYSDV